MTQRPEYTGPPLAEAQAVLTINLAALADNWRRLRDLSAPAECAAVVKANAYGVGIEPAVRSLLAAGCRTFFVAHVSEGARVRAAIGDANHIAVYCLNGVLPAAGVWQTFRDHGLRPVIGSLDELQHWVRDAQSSAPAPVALQFNTGMNRLGIDAAQAQDVLTILQSSNLTSHVDLVMSHFASSEIPGDPLNDAQIAAFERVRSIFTGFRTSMANSSGIFLPQKPHYDLVRPGYALYGGNPTPGKPNPMQSVVKLQAPIIQLRSVEAGETVGYNAQWTAQKRSRLATIGIGYADGIPRSAMGAQTKPAAQALVCGVLCPIAGRVSMDLIVLDVSAVPEGAATPGVMAELLGDNITLDDLADHAVTIGYEILTGLGRRYHRIYVNAP